MSIDTTKITERQLQKLRVADFIGKTAKENGKQFTTGDEGLADLIAHSLCRMISLDSAEKVKFSNKALISSFKLCPPKVNLWAYLCMVSNWLAWAWHAEGNEELTKAWSESWNEIHEFNLNNLKGDDLKQYLELVD